MNLQRAAQRVWYGARAADGVVRALLLPAEALYRVAVDARNAGYDAGLLQRNAASLPVLSIGNVAIGGTGKTPVSHWFARQLAARGHRPALLHGGYAEDEPALHAWWWPELIVIAQRDRVAAAARAAQQGATVLVLDDGFQHRRLARTADVVLVAAERWDAKLRVLPRGPLREPLHALKRADLVIVTRRRASAARAAAVAREIRERWQRETAVMHLRPTALRRADVSAAGDTAHDEARTTEAAGAVVIVSAIAEPGALEDAVRACGADVALHMSFSDHHTYDAADVQRIRDTAGERNIVTTEKDWMKLRHLMPPERVLLLGQEVVPEDDTHVIESLLDHFTRDA